MEGQLLFEEIRYVSRQRNNNYIVNSEKQFELTH